MQGTIIAKRCHPCSRCALLGVTKDLEGFHTMPAMKNMIRPGEREHTVADDGMQVKVWRFCFWLSDIPRQTHTPYEMQCVGPEYYFPCHIIVFCCCLLYLCKRCQAGSWGGWQMWVFDIRPCQASATRRNFGQEIRQRKEFQTWSFTWS